MIENCTELANAIIIQAVKDYRPALRKLKIKPNSNAAQSTAIECERFFLSDWFLMLTKIDGETLIRRLKEEIK